MHRLIFCLISVTLVTGLSSTTRAADATANKDVAKPAAPTTVPDAEPTVRIGFDGPGKGFVPPKTTDKNKGAANPTPTTQTPVAAPRIATPTTKAATPQALRSDKTLGGDAGRITSKKPAATATPAPSPTPAATPANNTTSTPLPGKVE